MKVPFLKVITYNIHKGFSSGNLRFTLHRIRESLRRIDADLVFLQEIHGEHQYKKSIIDEWPDEAQFEFLADELWPHHIYGKNAIYEDGHHGNAILSKYPFVFWENIDVSVHRFANRSLLHGVIQLPGLSTGIHVICVHLGLLGYERREQLRKLSQRIKSHVPHDEPLIIAGDFNDWLGQVEKHLKMDLGLDEVFRSLTGRHARTFPIWLPMLPVDRMYYRGMAPEVCRKLQKSPWKRLSDHVPLYTEFSLTL